MTTPVKIVKILQPKIWIESNPLDGSRAVIAQHDGMDAFEYAVFNYRYGYTDNNSVYSEAVALAKRLGATEPVEQRPRELPPPLTAEQLREQIACMKLHLEQIELEGKA